MPLLCRLLGFALCLSFSNLSKDTKRLVDCSRIWKNFGNIRIKENNVRAFHVFLVEFASDPAGEVILWTHVVPGTDINLPIHIVFFHSLSRVEH